MGAEVMSKNGCRVIVERDGEISFECLSNDCSFMRNEDRTRACDFDMESDDSCENKKAQMDALKRASEFIQVEIDKRLAMNTKRPLFCDPNCGISFSYRGAAG